MDYKEQMEEIQLREYKRILRTIKIIKDSWPEMCKDLSWELDGGEKLNVEQMIEYCNKRIKELEYKEE